jgi:hypothetical protein
MIPIPYVPEQHYEQVKELLASYDEYMTQEALPKTGFIIPGKAAGFMYRTDSVLAFMECVVGAKNLDAEERSQALDAVVIALCQEAKKLGFKVMMGNTKYEALVKRAKRLGWTYVGDGYHVVAMQL